MKSLLFVVYGLVMAALGILSVFAFEKYHAPVEKITINLSPPLIFPPENVSINNESWKLIRSPALMYMGLAGFTECSERVIYYYDWPEDTKLEFRDTLWHEIGHALRCHKNDVSKANWGRNFSKKDDPGHEVEWELGMGMAPFVHDNPEFINWAVNW